MNKIIILKSDFPNDPTGNVDNHQFYVYQEDDDIYLFSVSSILGVAKTKRANLKTSQKIIDKDMRDNGFRVSSFIDCSKRYYIDKDKIDISKLDGRNITETLDNKILDRINDVKTDCSTYEFDTLDLINYNPKLR